MLAMTFTISALLGGKLLEAGPDMPVMDLTWWGWLLLVGGTILVAGLAIAWQAHVEQPPEIEPGEGGGEHHEA